MLTCLRCGDKGCIALVVLPVDIQVRTLGESDHYIHITLVTRHYESSLQSQHIHTRLLSKMFHCGQEEFRVDVLVGEGEKNRLCYWKEQIIQDAEGCIPQKISGLGDNFETNLNSKHPPKAGNKNITRWQSQNLDRALKYWEIYARLKNVVCLRNAACI